LRSERLFGCHINRRSGAFRQPLARAVHATLERYDRWLATTRWQPDAGQLRPLVIELVERSAAGTILIF